MNGKIDRGKRFLKVFGGNSAVERLCCLFSRHSSWDATSNYLDFDRRDTASNKPIKMKAVKKLTSAEQATINTTVLLSTATELRRTVRVNPTRFKANRNNATAQWRRSIRKFMEAMPVVVESHKDTCHMPANTMLGHKPIGEAARKILRSGMLKRRELTLRRRI